MEQNIHSFAVGASLVRGTFAAFLVKFRLDDNNELLTAWSRAQLPGLLRICLDYQQELLSRGVVFNTFPIERILREEAPQFTKRDVEHLPIASIVENVSSVLRSDQKLIFTFKRATVAQPELVVLAPNQCSLLIGSISQVQEEYDDAWISDTSTSGQYQYSAI
ncbi:MAG: hypothetical protein JWM78_848 [Verrucomicrobiaceae bacterium]|nr:hypothetical protein [Verrucomicrobiaceae bacterium]